MGCKRGRLMAAPASDGGLDAGLEASPDAGIAAPVHDAGLDAHLDASVDLNTGCQPRRGRRCERDTRRRAKRCGRSSRSLRASQIAASGYGIHMPHDSRCQYVRDARHGHTTADFVNHCCGTEESDWIEGISYEHDQDWYAYRHPCPGEDCMVRIVFQLDGGKVTTSCKSIRVRTSGLTP